MKQLNELTDKHPQQQQQHEDCYIYNRMAKILCNHFIETYIQSGFYTSQNIKQYDNHLNLKMYYRLSSPHTQERHETIS